MGIGMVYNNYHITMMDGIDIIMLLSILYTVKRQTHA